MVATFCTPIIPQRAQLELRFLPLLHRGRFISRGRELPFIFDSCCASAALIPDSGRVRNYPLQCVHTLSNLSKYTLEITARLPEQALFALLSSYRNALNWSCGFCHCSIVAASFLRAPIGEVRATIT